jgi:glycosyltransferase involved in cell wall biosynthesis
MNPETKRLSILFITANLEGGAGISAHRQAEGLRKLGHKVQFETLSQSSSKINLKKRKLKARLNRKFEFEILKKSRSTEYQYRSITWLPFWTLRGVRFKEFDVVHLHWINQGLLGINHIKKISKDAKIVWTLHSLWPFSAPDHHPRPKLDPRTLNKLEFIIYKSVVDTNLEQIKYVSQWIVPSTYMQDCLPNNLKKKIIANPIPAPKHNLSEKKAMKYFTFVCAGDVFDPRKGLKDLLKAWHESRAFEDGYQLFIVGPLHESTAPRDLVALGKISNVVFLGELSFDSVTEIYSAGIAQIVPSIEETFGQVIVEPLISGIPVIVRESLPSLLDFEPLSDGIVKVDFDTRNFRSALDSAELKRYSSDRYKVAKIAQDLFGFEKISNALAECYTEASN